MVQTVTLTEKEADIMAIKTFELGSTVYKCKKCKRATRNTGDEGDCRLCFECFELAGIDNEISDNGPLGEDSSKRAYVIELLARLKNKHKVDLNMAWGRTNIAKFIPQVVA
jgi:hypothetical protein